MPFANHVSLQGYLEISEVRMLSLDSTTVPVLHGYLHSGEFLATHRLLITAAPANITLDMLRQHQNGAAGGGIALEITEGGARLVAVDPNRPLVAVEGRLLSSPTLGCVVDVKWITFLSLVSADAPLTAGDRLLRDLVNQWENLSAGEKEQIHALLLAKQKKQRRRSV
ncbi:MAG: hypothetical protein WHV66_00155 [Anaerolineales bacterium]